MTVKQGEIQEKWDLVPVSEEFELKEFELSGFCSIYSRDPVAFISPRHITDSQENLYRRLCYIL